MARRNPHRITCSIGLGALCTSYVGGRLDEEEVIDVRVSRGPAMWAMASLEHGSRKIAIPGTKGVCFILQGYPPLPGFHKSCLILPGLSCACAGHRQTTGIFGRRKGSSWRASGAALPTGSPVPFRSGIKFIQSFCQPMLRLRECISGRSAFLSHSLCPSVN